MERHSIWHFKRNQSRLFVALVDLPKNLSHNNFEPYVAGGMAAAEELGRWVRSLLLQITYFTAS